MRLPHVVQAHGLLIAAVHDVDKGLVRLEEQECRHDDERGWRRADGESVDAAGNQRAEDGYESQRHVVAGAVLVFDVGDLVGPHGVGAKGRVDVSDAHGKGEHAGVLIVGAQPDYEDGHEPEAALVEDRADGVPCNVCLHRGGCLSVSHEITNPRCAGVIREPIHDTDWFARLAKKAIKVEKANADSIIKFCRYTRLVAVTPACSWRFAPWLTLSPLP